MSDSVTTRKLRRACREGELERVQELIREGVDPSGTTAKDKQFSLSAALQERRFDIAAMLFDAGAKPREAADQLEWLVQSSDDNNAKDRQAWVRHILDDPCTETGLIAQPIVTRCVEADQPDLDLIERLLAVCGEPDQWSARWSPLCSAIREQHAELAMWLIDQGFHHRSHQDHELPPACIAMLSRLDRVLQRLIEIGEDSNRIVSAHALKFKGAEHACDLYPRNDRFEIFRSGTLLHYAAIVGDGACAEVLLDAGADVEAVDSESRTPADLAAIGGEFTKEVAALLPSSN